ncbi:acid-sensing ion channel 1 isoform X3 [Malaclemys terrapin pileata]|uniref:acid-sensing ion channel 1 isoform X2 n=1 Tax=Chrysemys picta bellii TaxID=8478 RepID=UPI0023A7AD04|nr:acid-sensing ion channel 1 isoform X3 [Malaclemys terrapin pileata]
MMDLKVDEEEVENGHPVSIQAFASSSTLHGLSHIISYERFSFKRILWTLCFLGSVALLAYVCTERIQYYFLYPHVTKLDEVATTRLTFPAVTFCNLNEFRFSRVTKNDLYHAGELLALLNNRYEIPDTQMADEKQLEILHDKANFRNFKPKPFNMLEFYDRAGHDIREMLLSCFFRGMECNPEDFKVVFTRYGKCYTFNSGQDGKPRRITMKGGTGNGLEIMLDIQQDEYLPVWGETGDAPYCTPEQYKECADPALDFLLEKDNDYCVCEMPCNVTRFGKELSMVKIPSKASAKYLAKKYNKSEQYIGENFLVLDIFFEALNYETIEQKKAYEVAGLLGDIGGQMGLFIGASILTVLELFDYAYEVIKYKLCRRAKCQKNHKRNNTDKGVALSMDDVKRHNPCESLRGHPAGMTYAANILPHHPARGTFEDFTC